MKLRIITSVAVAAGLALSLSACQKKAEEAAPAADAAAAPAADANAAAAAPADAAAAPAAPAADAGAMATTPEKK